MILAEIHCVEKLVENWRLPLILWSIFSSMLHLWLSSSDYYYADTDRVTSPELGQVKTSNQYYIRGCPEMTSLF